MESTILTKYIDRIYKYALSRTFSEEEAEELSQEILLNALVSLPKLREECKFEPWLWGLAENISRSFRRKLGKQRAMFVYNAPESLIEEVVLDEDDEELYDELRKKIVMLSKMYREVVILHYYDGLSTKAIAARLGIPLGTVTWWLSEARNKLRKEYENMQETVLRPINMRLDIYGSGDYGKEKPCPDVYINDALSQNILYYCYEDPKNVEELAKLRGVPAYYVEDRIENLIKRCAVIQPVKGKYQTDFIIWTDKYGKYCEENAEKTLMPIMDRLAPLMTEYFSLVEKFLVEYKKIFPKHLEEDAERMCCGFFMGFYDAIAGYCIKKGRMQKPDSSWICDVMVQRR